MKKIRVLIADDHAVFREGIRVLLARRKDIQVIGQAENGKQAIEQVAAHQPDVVLMDIAMPVMDGLEATRAIHPAFPNTRVLVLTQYESREYVYALLRAGAAGYVLKLSRIDDLVEAIRTVHTKGAFLQPDLFPVVVEGIGQPSAEKDPQQMLTEREKQVMCLIAEGLSGREIAKSGGTVWAESRA